MNQILVFFKDGNLRIFSPLPLPRAKLTSWMKNATSLPIPEAKTTSFSLDKFKCQYLFNPRSTLAAFEDPPPKPAPTGMRFNLYVQAGT